MRNGFHVASSVIVLAISLMASSVFAQEPPAHQPPPPDGRIHGGGMTGQFRGEVIQHFDVMRGYIDIVDRFSRLSRDPTTAGVAAVIAAADILKPRGPEAGIEYFTAALESVKSDAVKRAIRIQLVHLHQHEGQPEKALEHLTELMNAAPAGAGESQMPPPPGR